jgi:hypothetical protein
MTNQLPVDQVAALKNRDPGEIGKCRGYEVVVFSDTADAWIGIEPCKYRIRKLLLLRRYISRQDEESQKKSIRDKLFQSESSWKRFVCDHQLSRQKTGKRFIWVGAS